MVFTSIGLTSDKVEEKTLIVCFDIHKLGACSQHLPLRRVKSFVSYAELGCYYSSQINTLIRVGDPKLLLKLAKYD
jgi:hypothetical protein